MTFLKQFCVKNLVGLVLVGSLVSCGILYGIDIEADRTSGSVPLTVSFSADTDGYIGVINYFWDFDDGHTSTEKNPTHKFEDTGVHVVRCEATNGETVVSTSIEIDVLE